jgi:hypothetical protein
MEDGKFGMADAWPAAIEPSSRSSKWAGAMGVPTSGIANGEFGMADWEGGFLR